MERQQSNTLHTPNISNSLSTGDVKFTSGDLRDLSAVLKNCPEVNQLWKNSSDLWRRKIQRGVKDLWKRLELVWLNRSPEERNLKLKSIKSNFIPVFYNCLLLLFHDILNKNTQCIYLKFSVYYDGEEVSWFQTSCHKFLGTMNSNKKPWFWSLDAVVKTMRNEKCYECRHETLNIFCLTGWNISHPCWFGRGSKKSP